MPRSVDTVLTINPDGTISADFTGHISAQGIDMIAATADDQFQLDRKLIWHNQTIAGAVTAYIVGIYLAAGIQELLLQQSTLVNTEIGRVVLRAIGGAAPGSRQGNLRFQQSPNAIDANSMLQAQWDTAGQQHTIIRGDADSGLMPIGSVLAYASPTLQVIDNTWHLCDGAALSRTTFARLFAVIGTTWGIGDGSTTFNLPDLRGRTLVGAGTGVGLTARVTAALGGEENHALTTAEMPSHTHAGPSHTHTGPSHNHTGVVGGVLGSIDHLHVAVGVGNSYGFTNQPPNLTWGVAGGGGASYITGISATTGAADRSLDHQHGIVADGTAATGASGTAVTGATGGVGSPLHNNMQPFAVTQYIIRTG